MTKEGAGMKKFFFLSFCFIIFNNLSVNSATLQANVSKEGSLGVHRIVDAETNIPIQGAKVTLPQKNYGATTDENGTFNLNADITGSTILSVEKDGYRPFSLTINEKIASKPMIVGIEKNNSMNLTIDKEMFHLGDNNYSEQSANASQFRVNCVGPFYTKKVKIDYANDNTYLVIGSIIGIDTKMARSMGQNNITYAYASPPEVFFNGSKIAEIQLNGDGQRIKIPKNLIKLHQNNEITIKTGRNLMQTAYIDYDDIEFMNLSIETN